MLRRALMAGASSGGDPYWANVSALLHFDGADGSTTFTDQTGKAWTAQNGARIETDYFKFGGAAGWFENNPGSGSNNASRITTAGVSAFSFGTGNFTVEGWFRPQAPGMGFGGFFTNGTNTVGGLTLAITPSLLTLRANGTTDSTAAVSLSTSTFTHIAFVRDGTTIRFFVEGVQMGTDTRSFDHSDIGTVYVGSAGADPRYTYKGMIDDLRITKGVARYTANFTPPTAPFPNS